MAVTPEMLEWYKSELSVNGKTIIPIYHSEVITDLDIYLSSNGKKYLIHKVLNQNAIEITVVTPIQEVNSFISNLNEKIAQLELERGRHQIKVNEIQHKIDMLKAQRDSLFTGG